MAYSSYAKAVRIRILDASWSLTIAHGQPLQLTVSGDVVQLHAGGAVLDVMTLEQLRLQPEALWSMLSLFQRLCAIMEEINSNVSVDSERAYRRARRASDSAGSQLSGTPEVPAGV